MDDEAIIRVLPQNFLWSPILRLLLVTAIYYTATLQHHYHNVNSSSGLFVYGQERPLVTIPRWHYGEYNDSVLSNFRTNVCARQYALDDGTLTLRTALTGLNITVAITNYQTVPTESQLFSLSSNDTSTGVIREVDPGLFVVILDELAKRAGFVWRNTYAAVEPLDSEIDGNMTWSELLQWELHHFDIAAEYWGRSAERMAQGISFPKGWFDGDIILVQSVIENKNVSLWNFLLPFDLTVWVAIVSAIIFTGILYLMLERLNTESDERELETKPWVSIFIAALTFTRHFGYRPNTHPARLLSFSWTFWALIISSAYTANLANFLIRRREASANVIVGTLEDALKYNTPVCVQQATIMDEFVTKRYPDMVIVRKKTEKELFEALRIQWKATANTGGCGAIMTFRGIFEIYRNNKDVNWDCSLVTENKVIRKFNSGFATSFDTGRYCTSLISHVMNLFMTEMINDGFVANAFQDHLKKISTNTKCTLQQQDGNKNVDDGSTDQNSLSVRDLAGIFIVHGCAMMISFVYAAYALWRKKKMI